MKNLRTVLVLNMGGTWRMRAQRQPDGQVVLVNPPPDPQYDLLADFPSLAEFCQPTWMEVLDSPEDSSNATPRTWEHLARFITAHHEGYHGVVVMHGTDTLAYTSSALSFAVGGIGKPIIISGAQLAQGELGSDAPTNLINSCRLASLGCDGGYVAGLAPPALREVAVVFGSRIMRGTRVRKYSESDWEAFRSVNISDLGRLKLKPRISKTMRLNPGAADFAPAPEFTDRVSLIHTYPGMPPEVLLAVGSQSEGLIVAGFGAGNIPASGSDFTNPFGLEPAIRELTSQGVPVGITTSCVRGQAEIGMYEGGNNARKSGAFILNDLTPETALVKMSWLLSNEDRWPVPAQSERRKKGFLTGLRLAMVTDLAGEVLSNAQLSGVFSP